MKRDISFIKNQEPSKILTICKNNDGFEIVFYYPNMKIHICFDGCIGILIGSIPPIKAFDNSYCFEDVSNNYYMDLFNMPKQHDKISKQNEIAIKYIFGRFFGVWWKEM